MKKLKLATGTEFYLAVLLLVALILLRVLAPGFYTMNNIMSLLNTFSYTLIAAIGMNLIIITSNIDVSTGALVSVICLALAAAGKGGLPFAGLLPLAMLIGMLLSGINGLFITGMKIPAIVATLATAQIFQGILPLMVEGSIYDLPASFTWLAFDAKIFGVIPASVLLCLIVTVAALIFMKYSRFAKKIYAIGNNKQGARLAGIAVDKIVVITYIVAGTLFGVASTIIATAGQRVTTTMGTGLEMTLIAAVVLGGTSTAGGSGSIVGTVIGAFILSMISPAINYLGISPNWSDAVKGAIIIISVVVSGARHIKRKRVIEPLTEKQLRKEAA
ncbi:monosaccharide ABC transporter membrane protein (CUT2 family) [Muricomes intestini]|jgi:ribose/xylose/arabinose/galactoside ABC-type transport system permease subunit|uniref:Monosaccharide ABC transporter membrane protein (CUT2 family) n=1 Tax=Muricomes intestini TaxID=1796634 RepID=A0A4R3K2A3_9FIRM|nr:ABC transporter permease [Muricomes intestini]TCS76397.1 monosaccharide ABC transporter membrane protein (CUT2 family) [Muricomes intestini]